MQQTSSSPSCSLGWTYDVFLNFRGEDTLRGFVGNRALSEKGIYTFMDNEELKRGDDIPSCLLKAIEESRIVIIVFSQNYASSVFCLEELMKMLQCRKRKGQLVFPIFYEVEPSDVRRQRGSYGEALVRHEANFKNNKQKLLEWKFALLEAANLAGWHFKIEYPIVLPFFFFFFNL